MKFGVFIPPVCFIFSNPPLNSSRADWRPCRPLLKQQRAVKITVGSIDVDRNRSLGGFIGPGGRRRQRRRRRRRDAGGRGVRRGRTDVADDEGRVKAYRVSPEVCQTFQGDWVSLHNSRDACSDIGDMHEYPLLGVKFFELAPLFSVPLMSIDTPFFSAHREKHANFGK